jgi:hypothetical protein
MHISRCCQLLLTVTVRCQWPGKWIRSFSYNRTEEKINHSKDRVNIIHTSTFKEKEFINCKENLTHWCTHWSTHWCSHCTLTVHSLYTHCALTVHSLVHSLYSHWSTHWCIMYVFRLSLLCAVAQSACVLPSVTGHSSHPSINIWRGGGVQNWIHC